VGQVLRRGMPDIRCRELMQPSGKGRPAPPASTHRQGGSFCTFGRGSAAL